jgi:hypothetical protein
MKETVSGTLQTAAQEALACQAACNLCGVVNAFARAIPAIMDDCRSQGQGTDAVKTHPVAILFTSKIESMVGEYSYGKAMDACERLTGKAVKA